MATVHPQWPHTLAGAIAGEIIRWDSNGLGVNYTFPRADQQMHPLGTEDRMALRLLLFFHRDGNGTVGREANLLALDIGDQA